MSEQFENRQPEVKFITFGNRKIRKVPLNWVHPSDEDGRKIPLFAAGEGQYEPEEIEEMIAEGYIESAEEMESWYMPDFSDVPEEDMGICVYETTSEGTPISNVYPNTPEGMLALLNEVSENATTFASNKASVEAWAAILFPGNSVLTVTHVDTGEVSAINIPEVRE